MKLLISNDDGIHAQGIAALANELRKEHDVVLCAPDMERSGASHSLTFSVPLMVEPAFVALCGGMEGHAVSGTPADCVKLGCCNLAPDVDMVVSGINHGANAGVYVLYSGTVSAAMEAAAMGMPALAVSIDSRFPKHMETAAIAARKAVRMMQENPLPKGCILNLNAPDLPWEEIAGIRVARLARPAARCAYERRVDPYGREYYWVPAEAGGMAEGQDDADLPLLRRGYITVTPLSVDWVDRDSMNYVEDNYVKGMQDGEF